MAHFIAAMVIGIGGLYIGYHLLLAFSFFAFGDDGFSWTNLGYFLVSMLVLTVGGFAAYGIGSLVLSAF